MLQVVEISEIKSRAEAINLSLKKLCKLAGVDPSTAYAGARGNVDNRGKTLRALASKLIEEEARVAEHIRKVAPPPSEAAE